MSSESPLTDEEQQLFDQIIEANAGAGNTTNVFDLHIYNRRYLRSLIVAKPSPTRNNDIVQFVNLVRQSYGKDAQWDLLQRTMTFDDNQTQLYAQIVRITDLGNTQQHQIVEMIAKFRSVQSILTCICAFDGDLKHTHQYSLLQQATIGTPTCAERGLAYYSPIIDNLVKLNEFYK
jgi:Trp operon repressor